MSIADTELFHRADRIRQCLVDCMDADDAGGWAHRMYWATFGDSTGGNGKTCYRPDAYGKHTAEEPIGWWQGIHHALAQHMTCWGLPIHGAIYGSFLYTSVGYTFQRQDFAADPSTCEFVNTPQGSLSYSTNNLAFTTTLVFVNDAQYYPTSRNFSACATVLSGDYNGNITGSWWVNPYDVGDPKTDDLRLQFRWAAQAGALVIVAVWRYFGALRGSHTIAPNSDQLDFVGESVHISAENNASGLAVQLFDYPTAAGASPAGRSIGPCLLGAFQITHVDVDIGDRSTGPGGFACGPYFARGGYTLARLNSEMWYGGVAAFAEFLAAAYERCKYIVLNLNFKGNDATGAGVGSFNSDIDIDNPPTNGGPFELAVLNDGTTVYHPVPDTDHPDQSGGDGYVRNVKSFAHLVELAAAVARVPLSSIAILSGLYHPRDPAATDFGPMEQALCDWVDSGDAHSSRVVVVRDTRITTFEAFKRAGGLDSAYPNSSFSGDVAGANISAISAANPSEITLTGAHGAASGDLAYFRNTNSTPALVGPYPITVTSSTKFTVPVNVTGAGTTGVVCLRSWDLAHPSPDGYLGYASLCVDGLLGATVNGLASKKGRTMSSTNRGREQRIYHFNEANVALPETLTAAPSGPVLLSGCNERTAVEAIGAGVAYIAMPETGSSRPSGLAVSIFGNDSVHGDDDAQAKLYGVMLDGQTLVLEELATGDFAYVGSTAGDVVSPAHIQQTGVDVDLTSPSSATLTITDRLRQTGAMDDTDAASAGGSEQAAFVNVRIPERYLGVAVFARGLPSGESAYLVTQRLFEG
jgi:hypothetical protein